MDPQEVFAVFQSVDDEGSGTISTDDLHSFFQRLFLDTESSESILSLIQTSGAEQIHGTVNYANLLQWIFAATATRASEIARESKTAQVKFVEETVSQASIPVAGPPTLGRAVSDAGTYRRHKRVTDDASGEQSRAPSLQRSVTDAPRVHNVSKADLDRAAELLRENLSSGQQPMTDSMLVQLTRATSQVEPGSTSATGGTVDVIDASAPFGSCTWVAPAMKLGRCGICFSDDVQVGRFCGRNSCDGYFCSDCMQHHASSFAEGSFYAMPWLKCPGCAARLPTQSWLHLISEDLRQQYLRNGKSLLTFRCPSCHSPGTLFKEELENEEAIAKERELAESLGEQSTRLKQMWQAFANATESTDAFVPAVVAFLEAYCTKKDEEHEPQEDAQVFSPTLSWAVPRMLASVKDPERRCCLQLGLLRKFPKMFTPCCDAKICFKCKVKDWHPGISCEDRQREEMSKAVQFCPSCGVATVKSEGCDHIVCVCGTDWTWVDPVKDALKEGDIQAIERMLNDDLTVDTKIDGQPLLHASISAAMDREDDSAETWQVVRLLFSRGVDATAVDSDGDTALYYTCSAGNLEFTQLLLTSRADPNTFGDLDCSPLIVSLHSASLIEALLDGNANPSLAVDLSGATPLMRAVQGNMSSVSAFLKAGSAVCEIDRVDNYGRHALYSAVMMKDMALAKQLLDAGASVHVPAPENTPLLNVVLQANDISLEPLAKLLLEAGSDVNLVDGLGFNALHCSLKSGAPASMAVQFGLVTKVTDVNCLTRLGETALDIAKAAGQDELVLNALLDHGATCSSIEEKAGPMLSTQIASITSSESDNSSAVNCRMDACGWRPEESDGKEAWLQFTFPGPTCVKHIQVAGLGTGFDDQRTLQFTLSFSSDESHWEAHASNPFQKTQCSRIACNHELVPPVTATMMRLFTSSCTFGQVLRVEVFGHLAK